MNAEQPEVGYAEQPQINFANEGEEFAQTSEAELREMWDEATDRIKRDPPKYVMRLDKKTLIKTEGELLSCQKRNIPLRYGIGERHALHLLMEEGKKGERKKKRRTANKKARAARRRNKR